MVKCYLWPEPSSPSSCCVAYEHCMLQRISHAPPPFHVNICSRTVWVRKEKEGKTLFQQLLWADGETLVSISTSEDVGAWQCRAMFHCSR
uniref:Uncharacterized protein n=1 Tax=Nothoprocta perdicaria TaxID=30464 RepID=A0A8C6ZIB7_NOTPE